MQVSVASEFDDVQPESDLHPRLAALAAFVAVAELNGWSVDLGPGLSVRAGEVRVTEGLTLREHVATVPTIELTDVTADLDLEALFELAQDAPLPDLDFLDAVSGHANLDATVGLIASPAVPRLKSAVRLSIREGAIDFKQLERGFHPLADAVLDFHVKGSRLELEKDIPLLPWDESTLLAWRLDADDRALAAKNRVRLGKLVDVEILESGRREAGHVGCYGLGSLALENIDIDVSILRPRIDVAFAGGSGEVQLGLDGAPGLQGLRVRGAVRCGQGGARTSKVDVTVQAVNAALRGLSFMGHGLSAERLVVADVSGEVTFEGLTPTRLTVNLPKVRLEGVTFEVPAT